MWKIQQIASRFALKNFNFQNRIDCLFHVFSLRFTGNRYLVLDHRKGQILPENSTYATVPAAKKFIW